MKLLIVSICLLSVAVAYPQPFTRTPWTTNAQPITLQNVKWYGAVGNGIHDDTTAFTAALTNKWVYVPEGTYLINGNLMLTNVDIMGDGTLASILRFSDAATGLFLNSTNGKVTLRRLGINGGTNANPQMIGTRNGLAVSGKFGAVIEDCSIYGFSGFGVSLDGKLSTSDIGPPTLITGSRMYFNGVGVTTGGTSKGGEFTTVSLNSINSNHVGLFLKAGDMMVSNCHITQNDIGVLVGDDGNGGHSIILGNTIHHNTSAVVATNVANGMTIVGNESFFGAWNLTNCINWRIQNNTIESVINLASCGAVISGNLLLTGAQELNTATTSSNKITLNYGVTTGNALIITNTTSGSGAAKIVIPQLVAGSILSTNLQVRGRDWLAGVVTTSSFIDTTVGNITAVTTNAAGINTGAMLGLGGQDSGFNTILGAIRGAKETASADLKGYLGLYTSTGAALSEKGRVDSYGLLTVTNGFYFPQGTNAAPTAAMIGGVVGSVTNHLLKNVGAGLIDYWSDGTTLWSKQIAP